MKGFVSILAAAAVLALPSTSVPASGINGINGGMPNRISVNVTVPKQSQGATFGERVNAGLHAAGSALANGAAIIIECGQEACAIAFPDGSGYRADTRRMTLQPLEQSQAAALRNGALAQGAALLGGALPGGAIVSAAVSSVGNLAGAGGGAASAAYAASGRMAAPTELPSRSKGGSIDVLEPLADGDYQIALVVEQGKVVEKASSGLKDVLKAQARMAPPARVRIVVGFGVEAGVLKTRHDTAKNSIGNIR